MKPELSDKAVKFKRSISPVRQIMSFADPAFVKSVGLEPSQVISFAGGWVNHAAPEELQKAYKEIVEDTQMLHQSGGYSPTLGMPECREALANYEKHEYNIEGICKDQIAIGASSTQLTYNLMHVLLNPGEKILLLDPSYCNFPTQILTAIDVDIIRFSVVDDNFKYVADQRIEAFKQCILTEKPKVVLLVSPDNPTSQIPSNKFVSAAREAVEQIGSFLVIDFAYKDIVFTESLPEYFSWAPSDNFLSLHSNSKWSRSLGRRLGWVEASEDVIEAFESVLSSSILCPDTLHQMALTKYITHAIAENTLKPYMKHVREQYKKAAEATTTAIKKHLGLPHFTPQGGLYTCIKIGSDGAAFVEKSLKETGVLLVPGWGFGRSQQDAVRVSYGPLVNDIHVIDEGMKKVGEFLEKEQQWRTMHEENLHHTTPS
jgi:aspartate/methionine/tyrosine aminotransferase